MVLIQSTLDGYSFGYDGDWMTPEESVSSALQPNQRITSLDLESSQREKSPKNSRKGCVFC